MKQHIARNWPCANQLTRNKDELNHILDAAHTCFEEGNHKEALALLADAHLRAAMVQLQRLYLNPEHERRCRKDFNVICSDIEHNMKLVTEAIENPDAGDKKAE